MNDPSVGQKVCRLCETGLNTDNDSAAHIIPSALGGRLKPKGILCQKCNALLGDLADDRLVKAFGAWPSILAVERDRSSHPAHILNTRAGEKVRLNPDGTLQSMDVKYEKNPHEDGTSIQITAGTMKVARQLILRAAKEHPILDPQEAEKHAVVARLVDPELNVPISFGPQETFGGALTAIWLFLIHKTGRAFIEGKDLVARIQRAQEYGGTLRYLIGGLPGVVGPQIDIAHRLVARSVPVTGELIVYLEILGVLQLGAVFASAEPPAMLIEHIYVFDVFGQKDRSSEFSIDTNIFEKYDWNNTGLAAQGNQDVLIEHFRTVSSLLTNAYMARSTSQTA